jgi:hypothetical protein
MNDYAKKSVLSLLHKLGHVVKKRSIAIVFCLYMRANKMAMYLISRIKNKSIWVLGSHLTS